MTHKNKIAFFYPSHYPVIGGSSVHGFYLVKYLTEKGFVLFTFPDAGDGISHNMKRNGMSILKAIVRSDLVYVRVHTEGSTKYLPFIAKLFGKKVVTEINGLPDELKLTKGYSDRKIQNIDNALQRWMRYSNAIIAVSEKLKDYCKVFLHFNNVHTIENGGERFQLADLQVDADFKIAIEDICRVHAKIAIWSGTSNPWQGIDTLEALAILSGNDLGFIIISNDPKVVSRFERYQNVYVFHGLTRDGIAFATLHADTGLAFYGSHSWCRYNDYYGSSLKYYEYRANGLSVVATPSGHLGHLMQADVFISDDVSTMLSWIKQNGKRKENNFVYRSWSDVANETMQVILKNIS